jgi:hypothetical protein
LALRRSSGRSIGLRGRRQDDLAGVVKRALSASADQPQNPSGPFMTARHALAMQLP